jgi:site-specific recombinase XerD
VPSCFIDEGKTPTPEEVQKLLLKSIDVSHLVGLRDRALLAVMAYIFARIGAVISLTPEDYFQIVKRSLIRFREKGGKVVSAFLCAGRFLALLSSTKESRWKQLSTFLMFFRRRQPRKIALRIGWQTGLRGLVD